MKNIKYKKIKNRVDKEIDSFFQKKLLITKKSFPSLLPAIKELHRFSSKGKRLRILLAYYSFKACGGKKDNEFLKLAVSLELLHNFLLIHDDIIDNDDMRRGKPTAHKLSRSRALQVNWIKGHCTWSSL